MNDHDWLQAHQSFLEKEKELTRIHDELAQLRQKLPRRKVEKNYEFEGVEGEVSLSDLFHDKSQLIVQHFMFSPDWQEGCEGCSFMADHINASLVHLLQRDVQFAAISRGPLTSLLKYRERMNWNFAWYSSAKSTFNYDFHVSFTEAEKQAGKIFYNYKNDVFMGEDLPGISVFMKEPDGEIYHTYSSFGSGAESVLGTYALMDMLPKGRQEVPFKVHPMEWVRRHDQYDKPAGSQCCH